jgi:hypothetical protein
MHCLQDSLSLALVFQARMPSNMTVSSHTPSVVEPTTFRLVVQCLSLIQLCNVCIIELHKMQHFSNCGSQSQWPGGLRWGSKAARLLGLRVRISLTAWTSVSCECCVLSGWGLCDGPIRRPEESYRLWWVSVSDLQTSRVRRPWHQKQKN